MMQIVKIEERRGKPRIEAKVNIKAEDISGTFVGNLSKNGIFIETSDPFAETGERITFELSFPKSTSTRWGNLAGAFDSSMTQDEPAW